ncbi:MAG: type II secretion system F family protein [Syntrophomonadaceae bacterium]
MIELIIALLVFNILLCMVFAVLKTVSQRDLYLDRLDKYLEKGTETESPRANSLQAIQSLMDRISGLFATRGFTQRLQTHLMYAGIPLRGEEYFTMWLGLIILPPLLLVLMTGNTWLGIVACILAIVGPEMYLRHKKDVRLMALNGQLGDALMIMANALRAGFGFQQAMDTVKREMPAPISTEFGWTLREMTLGFSQEEALMNLSERTKSDDLDMVITGIIIQRQVGGNLAQILENISETIRDRAQLKREVKVLTAQGRLSGIVIGLLPVYC